MKKKEKLEYYRSVRAIRDELLKCENKGRQRRLVMNLPNTYSVHLINGACSRCEVELRNGFSIEYSGEKCLIKCGVAAYLHWLKNNCT